VKAEVKEERARAAALEDESEDNDSEADESEAKQEEEDAKGKGQKKEKKKQKREKSGGIALGGGSGGSMGSLKMDTSPSPKKKAAKAGVAGVGAKSIAAADKGKNFDSKENASWSSGSPVPYSFLAEAFDRVKAEGSRLVKTEFLKEAFRTVIATTPEDLLVTVYLATGSVAPAHAGIELGIGDAAIIRAVAESTGKTEKIITKQLEKAGDLGDVARNARSMQRTMFQPKPLTVRHVFETFRAIALTEGEKSTERKRNMIKKLLTSSKKSEATYIVRALKGKLRIQASDQIVLAALAQAVMWEKDEIDLASSQSIAESQEKGVQILKQVFSECPSYDLIVPALLKHGILDLPNHCKFTVGVPVRPMLAKPTTGVAEVLDKFKDQEFTCEFKYDGERAQIHFNAGKIKIYSRNGEDHTGKYPDVIQDLPKALREVTETVVLDGELVAYDKVKGEILPFQQLQMRKRKDVAIEDVEVQVCYFAFDCVYLNGKSLLQSSLSERRQALREACDEVEGKFYFAKDRISNDVEELERFLDESIQANTEGLIVKTTDSTYEPSQRSLNWLKLKKDYMDGVGDSIDLVVVGAWHGKGKRTGNYGAFLLACYNDDSEEFETIGKVGTGFKDEDLDAHYAALKDTVIDSPPSYYKYGGGNSLPEVWFEPKVVWEIKVADWSLSPVHKAALGLAHDDKGISFRFPRFLRVRDDRTPTTATSSTEIHDLYQEQFNRKGQDDE